MQPLFCPFYLFHAVYESTLDSVPLSIPPSQLTPYTHPFTFSMEWRSHGNGFGDETREKCEDEEIDFGMGETLVFTRLFRVVSNVADFEVVEWCMCEKRLCVF